MAKRRNLKKEKQERNRAYARKFKKRKLRNDGRGEGAGNGVTGTANNGGAADLSLWCDSASFALRKRGRPLFFMALG